MALRKAEARKSEYEMFSEYRRTKDKSLRAEIIESYTYIAEILSRRFINRGIDYEDIYQVACVGIIKAVDRFDLNRGVKFVTYATPTVLGEIKKYFRDRGSFIKIPRRLYEVFCKADQIRRSNAKPDGEHSLKEAAKVLNLPESVVSELERIGDVTFIESIEREAFGEGNLTVSNVVGIEDEQFLMIENHDFIEYLMSQLSDDDKRFIDLRYNRDMTQSQIAEELNVSQMQVSRTEKRLLKKMRDLYFRD
ncbi:MAG: sigma-70 family RNA polymerase sigma factor [Firmicutes bacterium]|nr:sigma-70 family RNA polymerase sigma factor [Bacillota bacterium]